MKKTLVLLACFAFAGTAAHAQSTQPVDPSTAKTETNVRANGTVRTKTIDASGAEVSTKTGRTNTGEVIHAGKEGTKKVAHKTGNVAKKGFKKTKHAVQKGSDKVADKAKDVAD